MVIKTLPKGAPKGMEASELLGSQQCDQEISGEEDGGDATKNEVEHRSPLSEPRASADIQRHQAEQAQAHREINEISHLALTTIQPAPGVRPGRIAMR
jgi:hypothetical protein